MDAIENLESLITLGKHSPHQEKYFEFLDMVKQFKKMVTKLKPTDESYNSMIELIQNSSKKSVREDSLTSSPSKDSTGYMASPRKDSKGTIFDLEYKFRRL